MGRNYLMAGGIILKRIVSIFSLLILLVGIYQYTKILGVYVIPKEATQENIVEQPSYNREWDEDYGNRSERVKEQAEMYFNHVENVTVTEEIPNMLAL